MLIRTKKDKALLPVLRFLGSAWYWDKKASRIINDIDPHAFVSQSAVIGVYGEGFDRFKVRTKKPKILSEEKV